MVLLGFPEYAAQTQRIAQALRIPWSVVDIHRFPDGESRVCLPPELGGAVVFCRSLNQPNDKLLELMLACCSAREQGAQQITLVAPYLCYMRQDCAFHPGEAVSQRIVGRWLAEMCDAVITVDPHLHRVQSLAQAVPAATALAVSAAPEMVEFLWGAFRGWGRSAQTGSRSARWPTPSVNAADG